MIKYINDKKLSTSFHNINHSFFLSLLVAAFIPTIYITTRIFWLRYIDSSSYSIAGQLSWVNLIYEVSNEAIIFPLYYLIGNVVNNKRELRNRTKSCLILISAIYVLISTIVIAFVSQLLQLIATDKTIIDESIIYIRLEAVANIFIALSQFTLVGLLIIGRKKLFYILSVIKLFLLVTLDLFLISPYIISAKLGVNGIAISNIVINFLLFFVALFMLVKNDVNIFNKEKINWIWFKEFVKLAWISGLESLIRNLAYMLMVVRMVNVIDEQGVYWVANNFIWGWILLPIIQLGELIKKEISINKDAIKNNTLGYILITLIIVCIWCILIPIYKPFMKYVLNFQDVDKLFKLTMVLFGFYILYAIQNIFDATFYGLGKINYLLFESACTNLIYYSVAFILYFYGIWKPTLTNIALLFGIGNAFDTIVSLSAYWFLLKKLHINICDVEININK